MAELVTTALSGKPEGQTHWSVRSLAAQSGFSPTSVHRYIRLFRLQPHRSKSLKLSNDPFFVEKVRDIVGLYLAPPHHDALCRAPRRQRQGPRTVQAPPSSPGVPRLPAAHRSQRPGAPRRAPDLRQLRDAQAPEGARLAGAPPAPPPALHPDLRLLAQSGRALVRAHHPAGDPPRLLPKGGDS